MTSLRIVNSRRASRARHIIDIDVSKETSLWALSTELLAEIGRVLFSLLTSVDSFASGRYLLRVSLIECKHSHENLFPSMTLETIRESLNECDKLVSCPKDKKPE